MAPTSTAKSVEAKLAGNWLLLEDLAFWREYQVKFPFFAKAMWQRAAFALFGDEAISRWQSGDDFGYEAKRYR